MAMHDHHQHDPHDPTDVHVLEHNEVVGLEEKEKNVQIERRIEADESLSEEQRRVLKRAMRKVDWRLVPILGACYSISAIDRINITTARIAGMDVELGFNVGDRYSIALLVFFITYFFFEIPSNIFLRKLGAANWLSFLCFAWGAVILGAGFAQHWTHIVVCRLLLGLFEAGFFPGSVFLISCWYTRYEVQTRLATFYSINVLASGFGSILAYGIMQLNGKHGYLGWRWIFIVNGCMTIFLSILGRALIVDFPDKVANARWPFLKPHETKAIQEKLDRDRQDAEFDELTFQKFLGACARWELWAFALQYFAATSMVYGLAYFIPIILLGMGYTIKMVFLLSAPPAVAAVPWTMFISWIADKTRMRGPWIILQALIGTIGLLIVAYAKNNGARYFGLFMGLAGANSNIPTSLAWQANNIRGQSLRMVASGLQVAFGAIGGIYASTVFMEKEAPVYRTGIWAVIGAQLYIIVTTILMLLHYRRQNQKASRGEVVLEEMEGFRYTY